MSSMAFTYLMSEQPTAAIMDLSGQYITEKSAHCCQNHQSCTANDMQPGRHPKCQRSLLRRIILPGALALFFLIAGLFALSYLYDGQFSVWGLDELLSRDIASGSTTSGSPLVKKKCTRFFGNYLFVFLSTRPF